MTCQWGYIPNGQVRIMEKMVALSVQCSTRTACLLALFLCGSDTSLHSVLVVLHNSYSTLLMACEVLVRRPHTVCSVLPKNVSVSSVRCFHISSSLCTLSSCILATIVHIAGAWRDSKQRMGGKQQVQLRLQDDAENGVE